MTTLRLPSQTLRALKEHAAREGTSLNRLFLAIVDGFLRNPPREKKNGRKDPIFGITRLTWASGLGDLAERHDDYLHGPVRKP
jgi:hypothetical protein